MINYKSNLYQIKPLGHKGAMVVTRLADNLVVDMDPQQGTEVGARLHKLIDPVKYVWDYQAADNLLCAFFKTSPIDLGEGQMPPWYFARLHAAIRNHDIPRGEPGHYEYTSRNDPAANEFRIETVGIFGGTRSVPAGSDRDAALEIIKYLNEAFKCGLDHAKAKRDNPRIRTILPGRMGHIPREDLESNMP